MSGHADSGNHGGKPELSENRVSEGRPGGALGHDRASIPLQMDLALRVSGLLQNPAAAGRGLRGTARGKTEDRRQKSEF